MFLIYLIPVKDLFVNYKEVLPFCCLLLPLLPMSDVCVQSLLFICTYSCGLCVKNLKINLTIFIGYTRGLS